MLLLLLAPGLALAQETSCRDGRDNDGDTLIDCEDVADCPNGTVCDDDASCTDNDRCDAGACVGDRNHTDCDDGRFCDGAERCNPTSPNADFRGCVERPDECTDNGEVCSETEDRCIETLCQDGIDNDSDGAIDCADADCNACPFGTTCHASSGECRETICNDGVDNDGDGAIDCADTPDCNGNTCDDGVPCTNDSASTCSAGVCPFGTPNHLACQNGVFCDGSERCVPGSVLADANGCVDRPDPCNDPGEGCNESTQTCFETNCSDGVDNDGLGDGSDCNDTSGECACPPGSSCSPGGVCRENICNDGIDNDGDGDIDCADGNCLGLTCDDGLACTDDSTSRCNNLGNCVDSTPNDTFCNDGLFCNGEERCVPGDPGSDADGCKDRLDPCTRTGEGCDEANDTCIELACSDGSDNDNNQGIDCNDPDCPCPPGTRCRAGDGKCIETICNDGIDNDGDGLTDCEDINNCLTRPCDDGVACTDDSTSRCNNLGSCVDSTPIDTFCNDGLFCNGEERCVPGDSASGPDGCKDRADPCTRVGEACDEANDVCIEVACSDGNDNDNNQGIDCNDPDCPCPSGTRCRAGDGKCIENVCNDGVDNDGDGQVDCADSNCTGLPCDDGFSCTANDTVCSGGSCAPGTPSNAACNDGQFCNGVERCNPLNSNADPNTGCVDRADPCTRVGEGCDEFADVCIEVACSDGNDNDNNQGIDCNDPDCPCPAGTQCRSADGRCIETACNDGIDNDGDGLTDCADINNCVTRLCDDGIACTDDSTSRCNNRGECVDSTPNNGFCDDGQFCNGVERCVPGDAGSDPLTGCKDRADPCTRPGEGCDELNDICIEVACADGSDNDNNQGVDCNDPDCPCPPGTRCRVGDGKCVEAVCNDGIDNDGDGLTDCADAQCANRPCDDGVPCTNNDTVCSAGVCPLGTRNHGSCSDGDPCNGIEMCFPNQAQADANGCVPGATIPCPDPGEFCVNENGTPVCREEACADGVDNDGDGPIDCNDPDCVCPDGTTCRANGRCPETNCTNGLDDDGDGRIDCADPNCDQVPCSDGATCTTGDVCDLSQAACVGTPDRSRCNDGFACTRQQCDPNNGAADPFTGCVITPIDDRCDDGASCTADVCDPSAAGADARGCTNTANNALCDNGLFCDGSETCDPANLNADGAGCVEGMDQCTDNGESCNENEDRCQEDACRDGVDNDSDGTFDCADSDCPPGSPEDCEDGVDNDCNGLVDCDDADACVFDDDGDGRTAEPCGDDCDDSDPNVNPGQVEDCDTPADDDCNGFANCQDQACLFDNDNDGQIAAPCGEDCDDNDPEVFLRNVENCTDGKDNDCDGLSDCEDPDCADAACDDGVACTVNDRCVAGGTCEGTPQDADCDDGVFCTADRCAVGIGCENTPTDSRCSDGQFCNGDETCDPFSALADNNGCVDGEDPCTGDSVCDEANDACVCVEDSFEPDDACGQARELAISQGLQSEDHTLCPADDQDRFVFDTVEGQEYTFFTTGSVDTLGVITDEACSQQLALNNDCSAGDTNFCLNWTATFTGRAVLTVLGGAGALAPAKSHEGGKSTEVVAWTGDGEGLKLAPEGVERPSRDREDGPVRLSTEGPYTLFYQSSQGSCIPDAFEPGDSQCATVPMITPTTTPQTEDHSLCPPGDLDGWRFRGESGRTYRFSTFGSTDTKIQIRSEDCVVVLGQQDDCGSDPNVCLEFTPVNTAFYTVVILGQTQSETGNYQFQYEQLGGSTCFTDVAEPDDACDQAVFLSVGPTEQTAQRTLCPEADQDTFRFTAQAGRVYRFFTTGDRDTRLVLGSDDCGTVLADESSCGTDGINACLIWRAPSTGSFKLRVRGRLAGVTGPYTLHYLQEDCPRDGWEPNNSCGNATQLNVDFELKRQAHTICPAEEIDFFEFFAQEGQIYRFFSAGSSDTGGAVLNAQCNRFLKKDESSGAGENFDLRWRAPSTGTFKFGVTGAGGPYDLFYQRVTDDGTACVEDGAEPDNVCSQGTVVAPTAAEQSMDRSLCPPDDRDHFTFQAQAGTTYRFWTEGDVDTLGNIRDASCNKLVGNDDCDLPDDLNMCIEWTAPVSGTFHVRVRGFSRSSTVGPYSFHFMTVP